MNTAQRFAELLGGEPRWRTRRGRALTALGRHRRIVGVLLAVAAVSGAYLAGRPAPRPRRAVLVATHDLAGGHRLHGADLAVRRLPAAAVPAGALRSGAKGRVLAGAVRRGEPLTDARLLGPGLLTGYPAGTVAAPVRIADAGSVRLVRPGEHIDLLAAATTAPDAGAVSGKPPRSGGTAPGARDPGARDPGALDLVAADVPVLAVPRVSGDPRDGALVVVAVDADQARRLARSAVTARLSVTIRAN